jgi:hypothetical protein
MEWSIESESKRNISAVFVSPEDSEGKAGEIELIEGMEKN